MTALGFNTQPPEGGWECFDLWFIFNKLFQHTAARRRLENSPPISSIAELFQHTAARRRLDYGGQRETMLVERFNTQPPEGGWARRIYTYQKTF